MSKKLNINPGILKLDLMLKGVRLDDGFVEKHHVLTNYRLGPRCLGNIDFILPGQIYVSAPYQEEFTKQSPYKIRYYKNKYYLTAHEASTPIKWISQPHYYEEPVTDYVKLREVAAVHGSYVSLALGGHRYLQPTLVTEQGYNNRSELVLSVDQVLTVLERIQKEQRIDIVSFSCWNPLGDDGGIFQIEPYIRAIKKNFGVLLFTEVHLPKNEAIIDATYAMGADSVCYHIGNLCSHGHSHTEPARDKNFEIRMLKHAVSVFPKGTILAHITVGPIGSRSNEGSKQDIKTLCDLKVFPMLTVENLEEAYECGLTAEQFGEMFGYAYKHAKQNGIKMNWFSRLSPFVSPIEGRYFVGDMPRLKLALLNFYQSRVFGNPVSVELSNLRRKLRVKEVSDKKDD